MQFICACAWGNEKLKASQLFWLYLVTHCRGKSLPNEMWARKKNGCFHCFDTDIFYFNFNVEKENMWLLNQILSIFLSISNHLVTLQSSSLCIGIFITKFYHNFINSTWMFNGFWQQLKDINYSSVYIMLGN